MRDVPILKKEIQNPYFSNAEKDYVYKAKLDIYGRYFGGILIIKKLGPEKHRVVFTTEFGSKLFDFLFEGETFTKNFMLEEMDKNIVVNTLRKDFEILLSETAKVQQQYVSEEVEVYKTRDENRFNFYFFENENGILKKIVNTSKSKEKVIVSFDSQNVSIADKIEINHSNIKLKISLEIFKNE